MLKPFKPPYHGAAYYPELWPEHILEEDISLIKQAGFNVVRIAEFAWSVMEPSEDVFTFERFKRIVDRLYEEGIAVIMCTPSATPPQWLTDKYEDTLRMGSNGIREQHGARRHTCPNSPTMRFFNRRITEKMAEAFKGHPGVIGWQIDNEIHPWNGCFCPICKRGFQQWLKEKYGTVENLNEKWGMYRWSLDYESFLTVIPHRHDTWNHPSLQSAYMEYMSDSYTAFLDEQAFILKDTGVPVGTDMMPFHGYDYYDVHKNLDLVMFNHYDDASSLHRLPVWYDFIRPIKNRPFWVTETQTAFNGSVAASATRPENYCYVNSWLPFVYGGEMNSYWHFRAHPNGHELMHGAVVNSSGRFYHTIGEIKRVSEELAKASDFINSTRVASNTALHFADTASRHYSAVPIVYGFDYKAAVTERFYIPMAQKYHLRMDVLDTLHILDGYKVIVSPFLRTTEEHGFAQRIREWVEAGGTWIAGPHTDINDLHLSHYTHSPYGFLEEYAGVYVRYQAPAVNPPYSMAFTDGTPAAGGDTCDALELRGAESLIDYTDGPFKGKSGATVMKRGKGRVVLLATWFGADTLVVLLERLGIERGFDASENVVATRREGDGIRGVMAAEIRQSEGYITLDKPHRDILTGETVDGKVPMAPYQVRILQEI